MRKEPPPQWPKGEPKYWEVRGLPYADFIRLLSSDLIQTYVRDARDRQIVRFWPASKGLLIFLQQNVPSEAIIVDHEGQAAGQSGITKKRRFEPQTVVSSSGGMDIAED